MNRSIDKLDIPQKTEAGRWVVAESPNGLNRPCPVCGNDQRSLCQHWCETTEFEVLRCDCGTTFINRAVNDNHGSSPEFWVEADPMQLAKARRDATDLLRILNQSGSFRESGGKLLDVGCGTGAFIREMKGKGWDVAGLELSRPLAEYTRKRYDLDVRNTSIEGKTGFPDRNFDVITMWGVIEHLADPHAAICESIRLLRDGGVLVLQTPSEDGLIRRTGRLLYRTSLGRIRFHVKQLYQVNGGHSVCFNRKSMERLLKRNILGILNFEQSTYGLRILTMRFEDFPLWKKVTHTAGTSAIYGLGRLFGASNHFTVYARRCKES